MNLIISKPEFEKIKPQALIIDVRNNWEYQQLKKLPNSIKINRTFFSKPQQLTAPRFRNISHDYFWWFKYLQFIFMTS